MRFYLVHERKNNQEFVFTKGAYLTEEDAKENAYQIGRSEHAEWVDGKLKWIPDVYEYTITETELDNPTFDIYIDHISRMGERISDLTLDKANELYNKYSNTNWVELQIPMKQFGSSFGVTKLKSNKTQEYWDKHRAYWDEQERIEMENEFYSPSCPWGAPGMRVSDFI